MTEAAVFQEIPSPTTAPNAPKTPKEARSWTGLRDPGYLALLLEGLRLRGRQVLYAATRERLLSIATDPRVCDLIPAQRRWELPPIREVVRAARRGIPQVLREDSQGPAVLGMMCLPPGAAQAFMDPASRGRLCLVVDGLDYNDPGERLAVAGLLALARRALVDILVLP